MKHFLVFDILQETQTRRQVRARLRAENLYITNRLTSSPSRVVYGLLPTQTNKTSPSSCGIKHDLEAVQEVNHNNKYSWNKALSNGLGSRLMLKTLVHLQVRLASAKSQMATKPFMSYLFLFRAIFRRLHAAMKDKQQNILTSLAPLPLFVTTNVQ